MVAPSPFPYIVLMVHVLFTCSTCEIFYDSMNEESVLLHVLAPLLHKEANIAMVFVSFSCCEKVPVC